MIKNNLNPVWNEAFLIVPGPDGRIEIKVTDSLELLLCLSTLHRISETRSNQVFDSDAPLQISVLKILWIVSEIGALRNEIVRGINDGPFLIHS